MLVSFPKQPQPCYWDSEVRSRRRRSILDRDAEITSQTRNLENEDVQANDKRSNAGNSTNREGNSPRKRDNLKNLIRNTDRIAAGNSDLQNTTVSDSLNLFQAIQVLNDDEDGRLLHSAQCEYTESVISQ